jgi:hypothetical protein
MRKYIVWMPLLVGLIVSLLAGLVLQRRYDAVAADQKVLRAFCSATRSSVHADLSALRSSNPDVQRGAIRRITDDRIYFGDGSVRVCLGDKMPDSSEWSSCLFTGDVPCVLARTERLYQLLNH